ncbi:MAG: ABC transporter permease [Paracoccaceae bacterium]
MFQPVLRKTPTQGAFAMLELIFHAAVRHVRKSHGNAVLGLVMSIVQTLVMLGVMLFIFHLLGMRRNTVRGDYMLFMMSGIFMFMTHVKSMNAVMRCDGPTSAMMQHAPMNTIVAIASAALGTLYLQTLAAMVILFAYHAAWNPITIDQPVGMIGMFLLAWISGSTLGMIFKAATPWQPEAVGIIGMIYMRMNMFASGKMFVVNTMTPRLRGYFDWNPLFHIIDQERGFVFLNYEPRYTSITYVITVAAVCLVIGLMGEFYTRKHVSRSWGARR